MLKFKVFLFILTISFLSCVVYGQKRIGFELSPRFFNIYGTVHYQQVFKRNFLFSSGVFFGNFGKGEVTNSREYLEQGHFTNSPYPTVNKDITDTTGTYRLGSYLTTGEGIGIQLGLGYFHEFSVVHGIRFNVYSKLGFVDSQVSAYYYSTQNENWKHVIPHVQHFIAAISVEGSHTIRVSGRNTFYYGFKLPYYFSPYKKQFNPRDPKDLFYGLEPELSIGITHVIGTCD